MRGSLVVRCLIRAAMKLTTFPKHFCVLAAMSLLFSSADAATLISDSFTGIATGTDLAGRNPEVRANSGWVWSAPTADSFDSNGNGGIIAKVGSNLSAGVDLGAGYFANNPGVYTLSSTILFGSGTPTSSWFGIGFSTVAGASLSTNNLNDNGGFGWMILRLNGDAVTFRNGGTGSSVPATAAATGVDLGAANTLRLTLDTSGTSWVLHAFLNNYEFDLNGASAGTGHTWTGSGIPDIRTIAMSTGANGGGVNGIADDFQLTFTPVPEPASSALLGLASLLPLLRRKR